METKTCKKCGRERRITQFSYLPKPDTKERQDTCRSCNKGGLTYVDRHKILKEVYRHYFDFKDYVARTGQDVINYAVETEPGSMEYVPISISFSDLENSMSGINDLAPRKKEAFVYHILQDLKQKEVGQKMGITTVSVGQYVDAAVAQLSKGYFSDIPEPPKALQSVQKPGEE